MITTELELTPEERELFLQQMQQEAVFGYTSPRYIDLAGQFFLLIFHDKQIEEYAMTQLRLAETSPQEDAVALHCMVSDYPWRMFGIDGESSVVRIACNGSPVLTPLYYKADTFIFSADDGEIFLGWRCLPTDIAAQLGHFLYQLWAQLLRKQKTYLFHGGCVGLNGSGVILCGRGGRGKSTLAAGCLLAGLQYVAEDYLLLRRENGVLRAWPTYATLNLSDEMLTQLPEFAAHDLGYRGWKGKRFIDVSSWRSQFAPGLEIRAIVLPSITMREVPIVKKISPAVPLAQLIDSTLLQTGGRGIPEIVKKLADMVRSLPTWSLEMCADTKKNVDALYELITQINK